ncbi:DUF4139 domain-containing protein [Leisingera sp. XS_AS12]|uniref:DUF4139 domain-containing protein n=1 Tax=Leisingera sp. XS_AS12 TaxID=3241294 RepID=UPI003517DF4B
MLKFSNMAVAALMAAASTAAAGDAPIQAVTLFDAGVADIKRAAGEEQSLTLKVPLKDVNDVLKSLVVQGSGGGAARIVLDGSSPIEDTFTTLPVSPADIQNIERLLKALPGTRVSVTDPSGVTGGRVLGVSPAGNCTQGECQASLHLITDEGDVARIPLAADVRVKILDGAVREAISTGVAAVAGASRQKVKEITLELTDPKPDTTISYVVPAPIWKTAYRGVLGAEGEVSLQAWAVIENATGEDWSDISLTLSSGAPKTLQSDLHSREWAVRDRYENEDGGPVFAKAARLEAFSADSMGFAAGMAPELMAAEVSAAGHEGALATRFTFPDLIDLPSGKMMSVPFIAGSLDGHYYSVWTGGAGERKGAPELQLVVTNDLPVRLPPGIMTIHDAETGYAGDAAFPMIAPGATGSVAFGMDQKTEVSEIAGLETREAGLVVSGGTVLLKDVAVRSTRYLVTAPKQESRELLIEHPLQHGATPSVSASGAVHSVEPDNSRPGWVMIRVELPAGEAHEISVEEQLPRETLHRLSDVTPAEILDWMAWQGLKRTQHEVLARALDIKTLLEELQGKREALLEKRGAAIEDQRRSRDMLSVLVRGSMEHSSFLETLMEAENQINMLSGSLRSVDEAMEKVRSELEGLGEA